MYSDEEIQALVDQFLFAPVSVPRLQGGARDVLAARDAVFDLLTATLLLKPDAYYYFVLLARNALLGYLQRELAAVEEILAAGPNLARQTFPIEDTTALAAAQAALLELNGALSGASAGLRGTTAPAVKKFSDSVLSFAHTQLAPNAISGGSVVETPAELRAKIRSSWSTARSYRDDNAARLELWASAFSTFAAVKIPARTMSSLVSKMQTRLRALQTDMEGSAAIEKSRTTFLELMTMKALLLKTANFKAPEQVVYRGPFSFADSPGIPPTVTALGVSAPYALGPSTTFLVTTDLGGVAITLSADSRATLLSTTSLSFPISLAGTTATVDYGLAGSISASLSGSYASGSALATYLSSQLTGVSVSWNGSAIVLRDAAGDASYLSIHADTAAEQAFVALLFPGMPLTAEASHYTLEQLAKEVSTQAPSLRIESTGAGNLGVYDGYNTGTALTAGIPVLGVAFDGTQTWTAPSSLEGLGVKPGMVVSYGTGSALILSVSQNVIIAPAVLAAGTYAVNLGADLRDIPVGAVAEVSGPERVRGTYRVVGHPATTWNAVTIDRAPVDSDVSFTLLERRAVLIHGVPSTSSEIVSLTSGASALGFPTGTVNAVSKLTRLNALNGVDLLQLGVLVGDTLICGAEIALVRSVYPNYLLVADPLTYVALPPDLICKVERTAHATFTAATAVLAALPDPPDMAALDAEVNRLGLGGGYTTASNLKFLAYRTYLVGVIAALRLYTSGRDPAAEHVTTMLAEQGMDRALDLLLRLDLEAFYGLAPDGVSYATNLIRTAVTATRELAPVSSGAKSAAGASRLVGVLSRVRSYDPWSGS